MRIYWIDEFDKGKLGTMPRPKGNEWLPSEIAYMAKENVNLVVSLLEREEAADLGLRFEGKLCHENNMDFINFPIQDFTLPKDEKAFFNLVNLLSERLNKEERVVIHCRAGIGRSSVLAASILLKNGANKETVFEVISKYRTIDVPDTEEQVKWVMDRF